MNLLIALLYSVPFVIIIVYNLNGIADIMAEGHRSRPLKKSQESNTQPLTGREKNETL